MPPLRHPQLARIARKAVAVTVDDLFGLGCAYEMYALATGRVPPITRLCRGHRGLVLPVAAVFIAHLLTRKEIP